MDNGVNIHLSDEMLAQMRRAGQGTSGTEITASLVKWQRLINQGKRDLLQTFTAKELEEIEKIITTQVKVDKLTHREFWSLSTERLGEIVRLYEEKLGERMVRLGELAGMTIKERVCEVIVFPPGTGGRPKSE